MPRPPESRARGPDADSSKRRGAAVVTLFDRAFLYWAVRSAGQPFFIGD